MSKIEWTDLTWNPITGCTPISAGCENCYAKRMAARLHGQGLYKYRNVFEVTCHEDELAKRIPGKNKKVFVCSMSDLFHKSIPSYFFEDVMARIEKDKHHTFQVLTKRANGINPVYDYPDNMWLGVTVENGDYAWRVDKLAAAKAKVKFISFEPLLGDVSSVDISRVDWVIVGGETGSSARPMKAEWVDAIYKKCVDHGVPFFFKNWGGRKKRHDGDLYNGIEHKRLPGDTHA